MPEMNQGLPNPIEIGIEALKKATEDMNAQTAKIVAMCQKIEFYLNESLTFLDGIHNEIVGFLPVKGGGK